MNLVLWDDLPFGRNMENGMKRFNTVLWYLGVAASVVILAIGFLTGNCPLSLTALILGIVLQKTNKYVELPAIYRELGITNRVFEGRGSRNEEDNQ